MKKYEVTVKSKKFGEKVVSVLIDDDTAKVLNAVDEKTRIKYLQDEYSQTLSDRRETRRTSSIDYLQDRGYEVADDSNNPESVMETNERMELLHKAIEELEPQQRWLINEIYFNGRKQRDIANELNIDETAISHRLSRILERLKKIIQQNCN